MRRIATGSNRNPAIDLFGPGKHGFKTGNRSLGDPPSTPGGEWFNSIQEELARVVEATGVSLDPAKFDQLLTSIKFIAWGAGKTAAPWAPLSSPVLTGTPTAPTATDGTNTTQIASTAFVQSAVGGYLSKSITGGTVTLTDAEASNPVLGFSGTLTSNATVVLPASIKRLWAIYNATSGAYTVTVKLTSGTGVTVAQGKRNLVYTDGSNVYDGFNDFESVALTGAPTAPTAAVDTSTTQIASTAFVINQASSTTPIVDGTAAVGTSKRYARADHVHPTDTSLAPVASPTLTGVPTAPTATAATASSQLATTAHVHSVFDLRTYKSPDLSIANSGSVTMEHGLGSVPVGVFISLKCAVAEMGYAVGDVIILSAQSDPNSSAEGLSVIKTATQLIALVGENGPGMYPNKTGGGGGILTAAKWKLILTAIK